MKHERPHHGHLIAGAALALFCSAACQSGMVTARAYASATDQEEHELWKLLEPGNRVVLHAPEGSCTIKRAATLRELEDGGGEPVAGKEYANGAVLEVTSAKVQTAEAWIAIGVRDSAGSEAWLRAESGGPLGCVYAAPEGIDDVRKLAGTKFVFAPWKASCNRIHAAGSSPSSMLVEAEPGSELEVAGLAIGASTARAYAAKEGGGTLWVELNNGAIAVRADILGSCFVGAGDPESKPPPEIAGRLHMASGRCSETDDQGRAHVECRTSLGLWEGAVDQTAIELRLVHRTLGPVHFLDGRPVAGDRYAKAVVAVTQGDASDPRGQALYQALDRSVRDAIAKEGGGSVRVAAPGSADVTYKVHVEVSNLSIGELQESVVTETTQYKVRDEERPNPDKPAARERVANAATSLQQEEQSYQTEVQLWETAKQQALDQCRAAAAAQQSQQSQDIMSTTCDVASVASQFVQPSTSGVDNARTELSSAESALAGMPDTITVPIMDDWQYSKRVFSRSTGATVRLSMQAADGSGAVAQEIPLSHTWSDYEVQGDPAHNVEAHTADPGPISNKEALVPFIAQKASAELAVRLKAAITNAAVEEAKKAFLAAGNEPKPGYEAVDAIGFDTAGPRIVRAVLRDRAELAAGQAFPLPAKAAKLGAGECLLAVAVTESGAATDVLLYTPGKTHADLRGGSMAVVEICHDELDGTKVVESIQLQTQNGGPVRWGLYQTKVTASGPAPAPAGTAAKGEAKP